MSGFTVWFTGLPSSGKSTLAAAVAQRLRTRGLSVEVLDGDEVRARLGGRLGFSKEDRDGVVAIAAAISPYRAVRDEARAEIGRFVEVFVDCPLNVCMRRDVKGLYQKALAGEIPQFTGVSDPYEPPLAPEVVVRTHEETVDESTQKILHALVMLGYVPDRGLSHTSVQLPTYLVEEIRRRCGSNSAVVTQYVTAAVATALASETTEESTDPDGREEILERLRLLGYLG
jgi:adenylyl-sulfate kinase